MVLLVFGLGCWLLLRFPGLWIALLGFADLAARLLLCVYWYDTENAGFW